jgi:peptidoglycan-associated lipoprotein
VRSGRRQKPVERPREPEKAEPVNPAAAIEEAAEAAREAPAATLEQVVSELSARLKDAYFDYDRWDLRMDAVAALKEDAKALAGALEQFPRLRVTIEGHCDERGSAEYNLALEDRRAHSAVELLAQFGVPQARLDSVSYGREAPQCTEPVESCWKTNRRAHVRLKP